MVSMNFPGVEKHIIDIPIDEKKNLTVILQPQTTLNEQLKFGPSLLSLVITTTLQLDDIGVTTPLCCKTVADESNNNLTGPQKEVLQWWHWKLFISVYHVQELMQERHYVVPDNWEDLYLPPILPTKKLLLGHAPFQNVWLATYPNRSCGQLESKPPSLSKRKMVS
jgi:hypothetical protein